MISQKKLIKIFCVIFLIGLIIVLRNSDIDLSHITIEGFREKINSLGYLGPLAYILFFIIRPLILLPAVIVAVAAGAIWGMKGFIYLQVAANLSAAIEFFIARYIAHATIKRFVGRKVKGVDLFMGKRGFWVVLLVRLIPNVIWDIQNFALGLTSVRFKDYFFATMIGIVPFSFAFVYFGSSLSNVVVNPKHFWNIIVSIILFLGIYILQKYLRRQRFMNDKKTEETVTC